MPPIIRGVTLNDPIKSPSSETFRGHALRREAWTIEGRTLHLVWPADIDALLDLPRTHERFHKDDYMPYWAQPWPGSVLLAEAVFRGPDGQGRPAIEIGCGIGIVSIAAALKGWSMTATDYDEDAVAFTERNAALNGVKLAGSRTLDYRHPLSAPAYDLVCGSDLLYERKKCEPVAKWLASALLPGGQAWLTDPNRAAADGFAVFARQAGLEPIVTPAETKAPSGLLTRGRIWHIRRRPA